MTKSAGNAAKTAPLTAADLALVKIHGSKAGLASFGKAMRGDHIVVDKTLVCKAFFDTEHKLVRVCAPTAFGKTYNLSIIRKFFGVFTRHDMPARGSYVRWNGDDPANKLDPKLARAEKMNLFKATLLYQQAPAFFAKHFSRHPVIYIRYGEHSGYSLGRAYCALTTPLLNAAYYWIHAFVSDQLDSSQREQLDKLTKMHEDISGKFRGRDSELEGCADTPGTLFACLSEFVTSACQSRCIVLIDAYDKPFGYAKDKPWSDCVQQTYAALLRQILDSSLLLKAMLTCNYAAPLEADSESILDVVPATYNCRQIQPTAEPGSEYALGAMFGFTRPEVAELMKMSSAPKHADFMLNRYGGYDFGYSDAHYNCQTHVQLLGYLINSWNGDTSLSAEFKQIPQVDHRARKFACANRANVVMLASCLVSDFDHGESSCFIWPSLQLKDNHCASAADAIHNFVLNPLVHPDTVSTESSIDSYVSLVLYLGYLTVGVDNSLRIPNNSMRDLWERVRLMATFGTWDQIQQDIAQHQLIDSLFSGKAGIVHDDFESALKQLLSDGGNYSDAARLELVCRYIASGLTLSKYTVSNGQRSVAYDRHFLSQPQFGKTWAIELLPFGRYIQRLVLLFRFSLIAQEEAMASSAGASEQLALDSLNKIVENSDAQPFAHCDVRLDLGVALGNGEVVVKQRLWKRVNDDQMDTSESAGNHENLRLNDGESVAEWAQRLRAMDNRGWLDSLGWMTQSTDQE